MNTPTLLEATEAFLSEHEFNFQRDDDGCSLNFGLNNDGVPWRLCVSVEEGPDCLQVRAHSLVTVADKHLTGAARLISHLNQAKRLGHYLLVGEDHDIMAFRYGIPLLSADSSTEVVEFAMNVAFGSIARSSTPLAVFALTGGDVERTLDAILRPDAADAAKGMEEDPRLMLNGDGLLSGGPGKERCGLN